MIRKLLNNIGLNDDEVKIYLTCLSFWSSLVSTISKKTWINRSTIYLYLKKLQKNGYLCSTIKNNIQYYSALDPEILVSKFEQNVHNSKLCLDSYKKLLPAMKNINKEETSIKIEYYEWKQWIENIYNTVLSKNNEILSYEDMWNAYSWNSDSSFKLIHSNDDCPVKTICTSRNRYQWNDRKKPENTKIINTSNCPYLTNIMISWDHVAIVSHVDKNQCWISITNQNIANSFKLLFKHAWNTTNN